MEKVIEVKIGTRKLAITINETTKEIEIWDTTDGTYLYTITHKEFYLQMFELATCLSR